MIVYAPLMNTAWIAVIEIILKHFSLCLLTDFRALIVLPDDPGLGVITGQTSELAPVMCQPTLLHRE